MRTQGGYTLAELVIVLVLTGILAAVAVPRMFDMQQFSARGTRDFVGSALRHAQKAAVAMRRNVCVSLAATQLSITYASAAGVDQACAAGNTLVSPGNGLPYADASNALPTQAPVATPASVIFDAQGRPLSAPSVPLSSALSISVTGHATPLVIEPGTGLVH